MNEWPIEQEVLWGEINPGCCKSSPTVVFFNAIFHNRNIVPIAISSNSAKNLILLIAVFWENRIDCRYCFNKKNLLQVCLYSGIKLYTYL
jgi:hypothetical protein